MWNDRDNIKEALISLFAQKAIDNQPVFDYTLNARMSPPTGGRSSCWFLKQVTDVLEWSGYLFLLFRILRIKAMSATMSIPSCISWSQVTYIGSPPFCRGSKQWPSTVNEKASPLGRFFGQCHQNRLASSSTGGASAVLPPASTGSNRLACGQAHPQNGQTNYRTKVWYSQGEFRKDVLK